MNYECRLGALKVRHSRAQGEAATRAKPWVIEAGKKSPEGAKQVCIGGNTCAALSGLMTGPPHPRGLRPGPCCLALTALMLPYH